MYRYLFNVLFNIHDGNMVFSALPINLKKLYNFLIFLCFLFRQWMKCNHQFNNMAKCTIHTIPMLLFTTCDPQWNQIEYNEEKKKKETENWLAQCQCERLKMNDEAKWRAAFANLFRWIIFRLVRCQCVAVFLNWLRALHRSFDWNAFSID